MTRASLQRLAARRPSHATIVAYLALFVALGGSGYAATQLPAAGPPHAAATEPADKPQNNKKKKNKKKKNKKKANRRHVQVHCAAAVVVCRGGPTGPQGPPGVATAVAVQGPAGPPGPAGKSAVTFFACVTSDAKICAGGVASPGVSTARSGPTGAYTVAFPSSVFDCAKIATVGGGPGEIGTNQDANPNVVDVKTFDSTGSPRDNFFYLSITC